VNTHAQRTERATGHHRACTHVCTHHAASRLARSHRRRGYARAQSPPAPRPPRPSVRGATDRHALQTDPDAANRAPAIRRALQSTPRGLQPPDRAASCPGCADPMEGAVDDAEAAQGNLWPSPGKLMRRVLSEERGGCCSPRPGCGYSRATRRGTSHPLNCRRFQPSQSTDPLQPAFALGSPVGVGIEGLEKEEEEER